jgi:hypothetical protein
MSTSPDEISGPLETTRAFDGEMGSLDGAGYDTDERRRPLTTNSNDFIEVHGITNNVGRPPKMVLAEYEKM